MIIYIFVITLLTLQTVGVRASTLNVRTTLFTSADLAKKRWNRRDLALLKARMYLQNLIPPMEVSQDPEYVHFLIRYIRDCYSSVTRGSFDGDTEAILTDAMSDVLGGYLKMVALPVTKYVYYGGDLPTHEALKLFKYYDDIKQRLHTHGSSWPDQVPNVIKPKRIRGTRSEVSPMKIKKPCQQLLYVQNSQQDLSMPMPSIDWGKLMMFVPLTNQPLVDLRSPDSNSALRMYHQVATACERSISPEKQYFKESFEDWVNSDVVPHLSDDELYTAFKGILSLLENNPVNPDVTYSICGRQFNITTKSIVVVVLVIIQIISCIPILVYILKKKSVISNQRPRKKSSRTKLERERSYHAGRFGSKGLRVVNYENASEHRSHLSSSLRSQRSLPSITDITALVDETCPARKSSHRDKNIQPSCLQLFHYKQTETDRISLAQDQTQVSNHMLAPKATSTFTEVNLDIVSNYDVSKDTSETFILSRTEKDKSSFKEVGKSKRFRVRTKSSSNSLMASSELSPETYSQSMFPTLGNVGKVRKKREVSSAAKALKLEIFEDSLYNKAALQAKNVKKVEFTTPNNHMFVEETSNKTDEVRYYQSPQSPQNVSIKDSITVINENFEPTIESPDNFYLEIQKEEPSQEINVQVSRLVIPRYESTSKNSKVKNDERSTRMQKKVSKIPKKRIDYTPQTHHEVQSVVPREPVSSPGRSMIPKLRRDLASPGRAKDKLNTTL